MTCTAACTCLAYPAASPTLAPAVVGQIRVCVASECVLFQTERTISAFAFPARDGPLIYRPERCRRLSWRRRHNSEKTVSPVLLCDGYGSYVNHSNCHAWL